MKCCKLSAHLHSSALLMEGQRLYGKTEIGCEIFWINFRQNKHTKYGFKYFPKHKSSSSKSTDTGKVNG